MHNRKMKKFIFTALISAVTFHAPARADFGDADFPAGMFDNGPKVITMLGAER